VEPPVNTKNPMLVTLNNNYLGGIGVWKDNETIWFLGTFDPVERNGKILTGPNYMVQAPNDRYWVYRYDINCNSFPLLEEGNIDQVLAILTGPFQTGTIPCPLRNCG
jgi:hypothetical protein